MPGQVRFGKAVLRIRRGLARNTNAVVGWSPDHPTETCVGRETDPQQPYAHFRNGPLGQEDNHVPGSGIPSCQIV
jgi:hypothetical protein